MWWRSVERSGSSCATRHAAQRGPACPAFSGVCRRRVPCWSRATAADRPCSAGPNPTSNWSANAWAERPGRRLVRRWRDRPGGWSQLAAQLHRLGTGLSVSEPAAQGPVLAIDIGGTKMAGGTRRCLPVRVSKRRLVATGADPTAALSPHWSTRCSKTTRRSAGVGVPAAAGPMDWPAGVVRPLNIPSVADGIPAPGSVTRARARGFRFACTTTLSASPSPRTWRGAAAGYATTSSEWWSAPGSVGDLILDGRLRDGATGNAGHMSGTSSSSRTGLLCGCGGRGCLEAVARGPAIVAWAAETRLPPPRMVASWRAWRRREIRWRWRRSSGPVPPSE